MTFQEFLTKQKINPEKFKAENPEFYRKLETEFQTLGEKAFFQRKKFHINKWRLKYTLDNEQRT